MTGAWPARSIADAFAELTGPGAPFEMRTETVRGRPTRVYVRAPATLVQVLEESRRFGDRDFLGFERERVSFEAHWRAAMRVASALRERLGLSPGDRVALCMRNYPEWSVACWGAIAAGAIVAPLNAWNLADDLKGQLQDCGARVLFADAERLDRLAAVLPDLPGLQAVSVRAGGGEGSLEAWVGAPADYAKLPAASGAPFAGAADDDVAIFYTSGTTGRAKGAVASHRNILTNLVNTSFRAARAAVRRGDAPPVPSPTQRCSLLPVPLFHVTGFHSTLVPALANGTRLVLMYKWDADAALELIERERVNALSGVPAQIWSLVEHPRLAEHDLSSLDTMGYGGAAAAPELYALVKAAFPKVTPGQGYGATETSSLVCANSAEDFAARPGSVGVACPACDVRIVGADGLAALPGETGELWARGANVVRGYWNNAAATGEAFVDGWYRTGDIATIDAEGFLTVLDRVKDMLIRGGENIYCVEIENVLAEHPAVAEVAVVGVPHRTLGEEVGAVLALRSGHAADEADLSAFAASRLPPYKRPVAVRFEPELPRNAAGKVLKAELRRRHFPAASRPAAKP